MLWQSFTHALRLYAKWPGFAVAAVFTLALGIGANTAIFTVIYNVILKPLPYRAPGQLVALWESNPSAGANKELTSDSNYFDWSRDNRVFENVAASAPWSPIMTGTGDPERVSGRVVTVNFFDVLGVTPLVGRTFTAKEGTPGNNRVAILSYGLWDSRFGHRADIIGQRLLLDEEPYEIIGVMPADVRHPGPNMGKDPVRMWCALANRPRPNRRRSDYLSVIARIKPGISMEQVQTDLDRLSRRMQEEYPVDNAGFDIRAVRLQEELIGPVKQRLLVVFAAVGLLLLISCGNVASLLLARASQRQREFAIRSAIGASRAQIFLQLMTESVVLGLLGGVAGFLLALVGTDSLVKLAAGTIPRLENTGIQLSMFLFAVSVSILTGVLFGTVPGVRASRSEVNGAWHQGRGVTMVRERVHLNALLVLGEVALALMLVIGAGLLIQSFLRMQRVHAGVQPDGVLTAEVGLPWRKYPNDQRASRFFHQVTENIAATQGVYAVAVSTDLPLGGNDQSSTFHIENRPWPNAAQVPNVRDVQVSPGYFGALGIRLRAGRVFSDTDGPNTNRVAVIGEGLAHRFWPNEDPIGRRVALGVTQPSTGDWATIIGVVEDVRYMGVAAAPDSQLYRLEAQTPNSHMFIVMRTSGDAARFAGTLRRAVWSVSPNQAVSNVQTLNDVIAQSMGRERFSAMLLGLFGIVALALASAGIYGVLSHTVEQRSHEMGVRMALGAQRSDVLRLIIRQGMLPVIGGVICGIAGALIIGRLLTGVLFGLSVADPMTFTGATVFLMVVGLLACLVPATRASRLDPVETLRYQ
jgi:putative ABC transport system permease protein